MSIIPRTEQFVVSLRTQTRVLSLWTGSGNTEPPVGWNTQGFNDSGWSLSAVPAGIPNGGFGQEAVAPWTTPPSNNAIFIARSHVTFPDAPQWQYAGAQWLSNLVPGRQLLWYDLTGAQQLQAGLGLANASGNGRIFPGDGVISFITTQTSPTPDATPHWSGAAYVYFYFRLYDTTSWGSRNVYAWGTCEPGINDKGVLGVGDNISHLTPTPVDLSNVPPTDGIAKIVSNGKTTIMLTSQGDIYACGDDVNGMALADGVSSTSPNLIPVRIFPGTGGPRPGRYNSSDQIRDIAISGDTASVTREDGISSRWGTNAFGAVGNGTVTPRLSPFSSGGASNDAPITLGGLGQGDRHMLIAGGVFGSLGAGANELGQLATGDYVSPVTNYNTSLVVPGASSVEIGGGVGQTIIRSLTAGGVHQVYGTGMAKFGSLGTNAHGIGTGPNRTVNNLQLIQTLGTSDGYHHRISQAGQVTFIQNVTGEILAYGTGAPFGGLGDGGLNKSGISGLFSSGYINIPPSTAVNDPNPANPTPFVADFIAETGGVTNGYSAGTAADTFNETRNSVTGTVSLIGTITPFTGGRALPVSATALDLIWTASHVSGPATVLQLNIAFANSGGLVVDSGSVNSALPVGPGAPWNATYHFQIPPTATQWAVTAVGIPIVFNTNITGTVYINEASYTTFAAARDGILYTWGYGGYGQHGTGTLTPLAQYLPAALSGMTNVGYIHIAERVIFTIGEPGEVTPPGVGLQRAYALFIG